MRLREVREELHIDIEDAREMGVLNFSFACGTIPEIRCHVFMATSFTGTPTETPEAEPFWCPVDGILMTSCGRMTGSGYPPCWTGNGLRRFSRSRGTG